MITTTTAEPAAQGRPATRALTVIVVTYRCRELALSCLVSLHRQELDRPLAVVVVDNDSRDGTVEAVRAQFPEVTVLGNTDNLGFSRACNQGLAAADGDVLLLNPDTVLPPGALRASLTALASRPRTGLLGVKLVQLDGSIDHACRRDIPTPASSLSYLLRLDRWLPGAQRSGYLGGTVSYDTEAVVGAVNGAFMLVRREALDEVGGLDERFWMYGEDLDWCLRFARAGWEVRYWPGTSVLHIKAGSSGRARSLPVNREFHRAMWLFYSKHGGASDPAPVRALVRAGVTGKFALSAACSAMVRTTASWRSGPTAGTLPAPQTTGSPVAAPLQVAVDVRPGTWTAAPRSAAALGRLRAQAGGRVVLHEVTGTSTVALRRSVARSTPDVVVVADCATGRRAARGLRARGHHVAVLGVDVGGDAGTDVVAELARHCGRPGAGRTDGPAVSVVATVLDEVGGVSALVNEVGAQLRAGDELVVVDGGSSDGTLAVLNGLATQRAHLQVLSAPGTNISAGRNAGVAVSSNPVVAFSDAGCVLAPGWLDGLRAPFAEVDRPGLVAGIPRVAARGPLERAQAVACYPDPDELVSPGPLVRAYTSVLGLGFDPRTPFARTLAVRRDVFDSVGGFPEDLPWVEDGVFGLRVAEAHRCDVTRHAEVSWTQRDSLRATVRMYRNYGYGAAKSGRRLFWSRDVARAVAYGVAAIGLATGLRAPVLAAGAAYVSLPVARALRRRDAVAAALVPVAMVAKDWGKVYGEACVALGRDVSTR